MATLTDATVETFESAGLSEQQARVQAIRLQGLTHEEIAEALDMELGTVKSHVARIDEKLENGLQLLPGVSKIETHARVTPDDDRAVVIWFDNGAQLRYRAGPDGTVYEETFRADDPNSVHESWDVAVDPDDLHEAALETLAEYVNVYRGDVETARKDWPHVYEALTVLPA